MSHDIIDNRETKLVDKIRTLLDSSERASFAVGYFFLSGLESIAEKLEHVRELRLLIGNTTNRETLEQIAEGYRRLEQVEHTLDAQKYPKRTDMKEMAEQTARNVRETIELMDQTDEAERLVKTLIALIEQKRLKVRVYTKGRLHAKAYIFDYAHDLFSNEGRRIERYENGIAIVGSSNLTLSGVSHNTELNVIVNGNDNHADLCAWFDELWGESQDFDEALMQVMRQSWAAGPVKPYDIYMKTLHTLVRERIDGKEAREILWDDEITRQLTDFQKVAVRQAVQIINSFGGVFVSDVVGLGKSFIGAAIAKHFERTGDARTLIICPAPLVEMWERANEAYQLNARVISLGYLREDDDGNIDYLLNEAKYRDFVLVDESHNFRNPDTQRYKVLQAFLQDGKRCCFLTATPRNKSAWDVYNQIRLFHQEDKTDLPIDPPILREYFKLIDQGERKLPDLLSNILIRRTRNHILRWYGYDAETGEPVDPAQFRPYLDGERRAYVRVGERKQFFPRRVLETIEYSIEETYRGLYQQLRSFLGKPRNGRVWEPDGRPQGSPPISYGEPDGRPQGSPPISYGEPDGRPQGSPPPTASTPAPTIHGRDQSAPTHARGVPENELTYARYGLWHYVVKEKQRQEPYASMQRAGANLRGLIRVLLFKRIESSVYAFQETIQRLLDVHTKFLSALEQGIVPAGDKAQKILYESDVGDDTALFDALERAEEDIRRYKIEDFDMPRLQADIEHDIRLFRQILALVEPITPAQDAKLNALKRRLEHMPLNTGKVLIFTQYADTAQYLYDNLNPGGKRDDIAVIYSDDKSKGRAVGRFAPRSNPEFHFQGRETELNMLIATDVLAEGLNLQDCDKIINYDLHWNPVRLIQRFGRIDRIGSEYDVVYGFNFLPETGIEKHLGLRQKLHNRIQEIHDTIGEDAAILDRTETLNEDAMYAIYEQKGSQLSLFEEEDEAFVDLNEAEEMMRQLRKENLAEYERIANLQDGLRAVRAGDKAGYYVFCRAGRYQQLFLVDEQGNIISRDMPRILGMLQAAPNLPVTAPAPGYNAAIERVRKIFADEARARQAEREYGTTTTRGQRYVLNQLRELYRTLEDEDARDRANLFDRAFRASLTAAVSKEVNKLQRNEVKGHALLNALGDIYFQYHMQDWNNGPRRRGAEEDEAPRIVCSEEMREG
jgi:superfamily II DNA/RNA helicase